MRIKYLPAGKRGASIYIRGRDASGPFEVSTGSRTRLGAETFAQKFLALRESRRVPGRGEAVTFDVAATHYKAAKPHLSKVDIRLVDRVAAHIGAVDCRLINHATLVQAADALAKPKWSDANKNRKVIGPAAAVLHYAAEQEWCDYKRMKKFWVSRKSPRQPATDETMALLLANAEAPPRAKKRGRKRDYQAPYKKVLLALLYELGLRLSDNLRIEWDHIDLPAGKVSVRIRKTDDWATLDLRPALVTMLANLPKRTGRLFPWSTSRGVYAWLKPLRDRLGITYTPHMSRHALATAADAAQIPDKRAAELGMWRSTQSLHRYQHVRPTPIPGREIGRLSGIRREKTRK
jgi:integrase